MARRAKHGNQTTQLSSLKLRLLEKLQEERMYKQRSEVMSKL